ncbi:unnamed protein product [Protopolystoma xenopodis]|uniref:Cationic amino acid transporter C-terminal domain-containing protein n=1 Tax=Protopolystoma xenopodis TaxID=117903 RepID=A0A448WJ45_9PLAT|nr:unnamed protein product [Protopolystoma xenopodis]
MAGIWRRTETPIWSTLLPGLITAVLALCIDLRALVEMMSSGTLLAYSLVCTSVLLLRYRRQATPLPSSADNAVCPVSGGAELYDSTLPKATDG